MTSTIFGGGYAVLGLEVHGETLDGGETDGVGYLRDLHMRTL